MKVNKEMKRNNIFFINALIYLEEQKHKYIRCIDSSNLRRVLKSLYQTHTNSINSVKRCFKGELINFNFENELELIREAFKIDHKNRSEWIVAVQESQQRILSCIDINSEKRALKRNLKIAINIGESSNKHIRTELQIMQNEYEAKYIKEIEEEQRKGNFKKVGKLKKLIEDIQLYTESIDEASDYITDLFFNCIDVE